MRPDFRSIVAQFAFEGEFLDAQRCGIGHINGTYAARFRKADGVVHRYILQRINHEVFRHPEELMHNIAKVTVHLREKIIAAGGDPERETLNLIPTVDGRTFYKTTEGNCWRAYVFIEGAQTYQVVAHLDHFYNAGKAFGKFQQLVSDFPAEQLYETIPDFHHTPKRFDAFVRSVERDARNRAQTARAEIEFVEQRAEEMPILVDLLDKGALPRRITHNDTKFNNVMEVHREGHNLDRCRTQFKMVQDMEEKFEQMVRIVEKHG